MKRGDGLLLSLPLGKGILKPYHWCNFVLVVLHMTQRMSNEVELFLPKYPMSYMNKLL